MPLLDPASEIILHARDLHTTLHGVIERMFVHENAEGELEEVTKPKPGHTRKELRQFKWLLAGYVGRVGRWSNQQYVDSYQGPKRSLYQRVVGELHLTVCKDQRGLLKSFLKCEKLILKTKDYNVANVPRVINSRSPGFNVLLGTYIKPMESKICRGIAKVYNNKFKSVGPIVAKALNARQIGRLIYRKWANFKEPVVLMLDARRFDQHVSVEALGWEHSVFKTIAIDEGDLNDLLRQQVRNKFNIHTDDGQVRGCIDGMRMSGDVNTGLGNCLITCGMTFSYATHCKVQIDAIDNGDDIAVFLERCDLKRFLRDLKPYFEQLGFLMEIEGTAYHLEDIEFCQAKPVWEGPAPGHYLMVRTYKKSRSKDLTTYKSILNETQWNSYRVAIAHGGQALANNIPCVGAMYRMMKRGTNAKPDRYLANYGMEWMGKGMAKRPPDVHPNTRVSFERAMGVPVSSQLQQEAFFDAYIPRYEAPEIQDRAYARVFHTF